MSTKEKKPSAFSLYRNRKASSLSDVNSDEPGDGNKPEKQLASANSTPRGSMTSLASRNSATHGSKLSLASIMSAPGMFSAEKKKKAERKKIKQLFKSSKGGVRQSWLPDSAVDSPIGGLNGNVTLKSMKQRTSLVNLHQNNPVKADPNLTPSKVNKPKLPSRENRASPSAMVESTYIDGVTPPLPPREPNKSKKSLLPPKPARRQLAEITPPLPPKQGRRGSKEEGKRGGKTLRKDDDSDSSLRPAKQRKLSGSVASPTGKQKMSPSMMNGQGVKQNREMPYMYDSQDEARRLMECLIHPIKLDKFFNDLFERTPLLVKRHMPSYYDGWFSTAQLDQILKEHNIQFTENLDVVSYTDGKRTTHNPVGRAYAPVVWDYYQNGCSVRMLNPQTYSRSVWKLLSILQEFFNCNVGANVYLTPPGTQGFAPHYDDIEAFIIQMEGKKHWRLYHPRTKAETLPRYSSGNFSEDEIGEPMLDVILEAGDLLYFPRGLIHQGKTLEDTHSLHMTISACQLNTWGDYLQKLLPAALEVAMTEDIDFRKSLPKDFLNHLGMAYSDSESQERVDFLRNVEKLMTKLLAYAPVDGAVDQMGSRFIHDSLPPVLTKAEKMCSIHGNGERWDEKSSRVRGAVELEPDTQIKLIRKGIIRLVKEGDKLNIYHSLENSRLYHEVEPQYMELSEELAPGIEHLLKSYPEYVNVDSLPLDSVDDKMGLVSELYDKGLLMTKSPLDHLSETSSEDEEL